MSNFFTATLSGKGSRGDKSSKSRGPARTSGSSTASHATSPTDLPQARPFDQHPPRSLSATTSSPSSSTQPLGVNITPAFHHDDELSSSFEISREFGAHSPSRLHAISLTHQVSNASLSPRKNSDNMSIRSVSSTMSNSTVQRPNDELGRYPSISRLNQNQGERLPNGSRAIPTGNSAPLSGPPSSYTSPYMTSHNTPPPTSYTPPPQPPTAHTPPPQGYGSLSSHGGGGGASSSTANLPASYSTASSLGYAAASISRNPSAASRATINSRNTSSPAPSYASSTYAQSSYAPSIYAPSIASHSTTKLPMSDEFNFPRPSDEEVEHRFLELVRNRDLDHDFMGSPVPSLSSRTAKSRGAQRSSTQTISAGARATSTLSISTKWQMVEAEARQQWEKRKKQAKQQRQLLADGHKSGRGKKAVEAPITKDSPEWFIRKVLDNQLTHQDLVTLGVSLRTLPLDWIREFMDIKGLVVMSNYLNGLTHRRSKSGPDVDMELELLKCLRTAMNNKYGQEEAISKPQVIYAIGQSLVSAHPSCRKVAGEILVDFAYLDNQSSDRVGLSIVLRAFEQLQAQYNQQVGVSKKVSKFERWIRQNEEFALSRGRMGSTVGQGPLVKGMDNQQLIEYFEIIVFLISGLVSASDLRTRMSVRGQLDVAGVGALLDTIKDWREPRLLRHLEQFYEEEEADRKEFLEQQAVAQVETMRNPEEMVRALLDKTKGTKASAYLLNTFRHMLLIKEEGDERTRFFQLIDQLIQSIVMHDSPDLNQDFARAFGISVSQLMGKFVDQQQLEKMEADNKQLKSDLAGLKREKQDLLDEMAEGNQSLVDRLRKQIADLQKKLASARAAWESSEDTRKREKADYETRIAELELYIQELFNMLRETNHLDQVQAMTDGPIDRQKLVHDLREQWERKKTIRKLEGGGSSRKKPTRSNTMTTINTVETESSFGDDICEDYEDGEVFHAHEERFQTSDPLFVHSRGPSAHRKSLSNQTAMSGTQFMDAEEERVRSHIEDSLVRGVDRVSPIRLASNAGFRSTRGDGRRGGAPNAPPVREKSILRHNSKKASVPPRFLEEIRYGALQRQQRSVSAPMSGRHSVQNVVNLDEDAPDFLLALQSDPMLSKVYRADPAVAAALRKDPAVVAALRVDPIVAASLAETSRTASPSPMSPMDESQPWAPWNRDSKVSNTVRPNPELAAALRGEGDSSLAQAVRADPTVSATVQTESAISAAVRADPELVAALRGEGPSPLAEAVRRDPTVATPVSVDAKALRGEGESPLARAVRADPTLGKALRGKGDSTLAHAVRVPFTKRTVPQIAELAAALRGEGSSVLAQAVRADPAVSAAVRADPAVAAAVQADPELAAAISGKGDSPLAQAVRAHPEIAAAAPADQEIVAGLRGKGDTPLAQAVRVSIASTIASTAASTAESSSTDPSTAASTAPSITTALPSFPSPASTSSTVSLFTAAGQSAPAGTTADGSTATAQTAAGVQYASAGQQTATGQYASAGQQTAAGQYASAGQQTAPGRQAAAGGYVPPLPPPGAGEHASAGQQAMAGGHVPPAQPPAAGGSAQTGQQAAAGGYVQPGQQGAAGGSTQPGQQAAAGGYVQPGQQAATGGSGPGGQQAMAGQPTAPGQATATGFPPTAPPATFHDHSALISEGDSALARAVRSIPALGAELQGQGDSPLAQAIRAETGRARSTSISVAARRPDPGALRGEGDSPLARAVRADPEMAAGLRGEGTSILAQAVRAEPIVLAAARSDPEMAAALRGEGASILAQAVRADPSVFSAVRAQAASVAARRKASIPHGHYGALNFATGGFSASGPGIVLSDLQEMSPEEPASPVSPKASFSGGLGLVSLNRSHSVHSMGSSPSKESFASQVLTRARTVRGGSSEPDEYMPNVLPPMPTVDESDEVRAAAARIDEQEELDAEASGEDGDEPTAAKVPESAPVPVSGAPPPPGGAPLLAELAARLPNPDGAPAPPPPPPPPPPPGGMPGLGGPGGMAGLLAGIRGGVNLNRTGGAPKKIAAPAPPPPPGMGFISRAPGAPIGALLHGANDSRKHVPNMASGRMKQLQWDKVAKGQLGNTVWAAPEQLSAEEELVQRMKAANLWSDIENEFKAKEIIYDAVKKKKETELLSVLSKDLRKRIEILMAGSHAKNFKEPEKLSEAIANFNNELCSETFLHELQGVLPNDDERGKLLTHSADSPAELERLHPADRLMVRLIQVPHLADRVKGMLFQVRFQGNIDLLQQSLDLLVVACSDLRHAKLFHQLLNVILTMGNYLNGTNFAGGAYGFKIGSINKLVDTKSTNGQNLLHFLERTVSTHFPELDGFLDELAKPSEANRVNFADMQQQSKANLTEIRAIRASLEDNFQESTDGYARKMFRFSASAEEDLQSIRDDIVNAEKGLRDVENYYGEGDEHGRPMPSQDFFGIFRTFTSSYKFCRQQNRARAEEIALRERRAAARAALTPQPTGASTETNLIDTRLQRLKLEGTPRIRRERRQPAPPPSPLPASMDFSDFMLPTGQSESVDFGSLAQQMMANLTGGSGLDPLGTMEPVTNPSTPTPPGRASNGSLRPDPLIEHPDEDAEDDETKATESRPTSTSSANQLIIDLSQPLKRTSMTSLRSSQRLSVHTTLSSASEQAEAEDEENDDGETEQAADEAAEPTETGGDGSDVDDDDDDEEFATPENKETPLFEAVAAGSDGDAAEGGEPEGDGDEDGAGADEDDDDEEGDDTVGDETIVAELPPSPSQIM